MIEASAADRLAPYGWTDRVAALFSSLEAETDEEMRAQWQPGRVVRVERAPKDQGFTAAAVVRLPDDEVLATCTEGLPAVGDWVAVRIVDEETRLIDAILPRHSALTRQDPGSEHAEQVLAANVDVVVIVAPLDRLKVTRIERELLVAWESGATPLVVLTKADLEPNADEIATDLSARLVGTEVVLTSARTGDGVDQLAATLRPNRTAVLFGPSGAGKSTLANALVGDDVLATADVREGDRRGRHTTTSRQLIVLPRGGVLIDTPGIRSLGVWRGEEGLAAAFADVEEHTANCRFRDCRHEREPGCGLTDAVASGTLDPARVASYRKLLREVEYAEHAHERDFQAARRQWSKAIATHNRQRPKKKR